jgi:iron complex transport system permease protein
MVMDAITSFDPENTKHLLVNDMRLPRVISSAFVGCALAVSGAIMQGMTRNPLADTGLMGLNSGAGLALAISLAFFPGLTYSQMVILAFVGASVGAGTVYMISSLVPGGNQTMKQVLAGATVSALLSALSQGIAISRKLSQSVTFWTMGSMSGTSWKQVMITAPVVIIAFLGAIILSRKITILSMGEEVAKGLGVKTQYVKLLGTFLVVMLAGTSVAVAGTITFLGMMIPHFARFLVGPDYRYIIPTSAVMGAILLVASDLFAKTFSPPAELPVGAVIALLGVPAFLYFAKKQKGAL